MHVSNIRRQRRNPERAYEKSKWTRGRRLGGMANMEDAWTGPMLTLLSVVGNNFDADNDDH